MDNRLRIDNRFRIESLTTESESNRIVRCQEIPTPNGLHSPLTMEKTNIVLALLCSSLSVSKSMGLCATTAACALHTHTHTHTHIEFNVYMQTSCYGAESSS